MLIFDFLFGFVFPIFFFVSRLMRACRLERLENEVRGAKKDIGEINKKKIYKDFSQEE